jgi:hydroxymethylpyrimidine pyrophosphatase-like HAD family hydrolase
MRYVALATDGDGTLTEHGQIEPSVAAALCQFRNAGGRVFLATGETITDLAQFPHIDLFDRIVAENGAVLFSPNLGNERVLCDDDPQPVVRAAGIRSKWREAWPGGRIGPGSSTPY